MSLNSGLTRDKNGALLRAGKIVTLVCDTGDDTPVVQDENFAVDINKLVSNEMARQELLHVPSAGDYQDLTEYPASRGEAEHLLLERTAALQSLLLPGETLEAATRRKNMELAQLQAKLRDLNAPKAEPVPIPSKTAAAQSESPDGSTPSKQP